MKRILFAVAVLLVAGSVFCSTRVLAADPVTTSTSSAPATGQETWRYRWHNSQWWYYLPSEQWVYWSDNRWNNYDPATYKAPVVATAPNTTVRRSYSSDNSPQAYQGNWGPVRYDRWGNVQYPYSQRKTGIRQLGAVPAMGGVRSLPGWGGER